MSAADDAPGAAAARRASPWRGHLQPPPPRTGRPRALRLAAETPLARIYDPSARGARALTFRSFGPLLRFDHHPPGPDDVPVEHADRAIWYGSWGPQAIRSCGIEAFGAAGRIRLRPYRLAVPVTTRELVLVDLRADGALAAGATAELPKWPDLRVTWAWARHLHGITIDGASVDGLAWDSARSNLPCLALFERAADALAVPSDRRDSFPLTHPHVRDELLRLVRDYGFTLAP